MCLNLLRFDSEWQRCLTVVHAFRWGVRGGLGKGAIFPKAPYFRYLVLGEAKFHSQQMLVQIRQ